MEKAIGVVLDISLAHEEDGRRRLDKIKEQLVKFIKDHVDDGEDLFYLYHPDVTEILHKNGEEVSAVSNYETDGWQFSLNYALKQTLYVVGAEDPDYHRAVVLITDRIEDNTSIKKFLVLNETNDYGCNFLVYGIGTRYNRDGPDGLENEELHDKGFFHCHLEDSLFLAEALKEEIIDGRKSNL